ncbi:unnamed protein product [Mytilus coruscus]|uniref:Mutator-like transposase domain-containing protein n=1 Tax=Mytilus coruscus TaxID=42192 RepID=A0A6J8CSV6_MYTCO|nr:unnamed protein product [Mytilus coruscus]
MLIGLNKYYTGTGKAVDFKDPIPPTRMPRGHGGVAIVWKKQLDSYITPLPDGNERIQFIEIRGAELLPVLFVYLPCKGSTDIIEEFKECIDLLNEIYTTYKDTNNILLGENTKDFIPIVMDFLQWNMKTEEKFGFVNPEEAMWDKSTYRLKKFKLYEEVQTKKEQNRKEGSQDKCIRPSSINQTPLGYTGLRKVVLGCNMPAPSAQGLQKRANKVLSEIVNINKKALEKNPYQPATQVVYSVAEAETEDKSIIGVVCKNKLYKIIPNR